MQRFFRQIEWFNWFYNRSSRLEVTSFQRQKEKSKICKMCKICLFEHKIIDWFSLFDIST